MSPHDAATALHDLLTAGRHGDDIRHLFTDDAMTITHPNLLEPRGGTRRLEDMLAGSTAGASLLASQTFEVHQAVESGDKVVLRLTWTGVVREAAGPFAKGQTLRAHIVQFARTWEGRLAQIETYDCYEPFE